MTFSALRKKEVINVCNGRQLGCVCDIIIDTNTRTLEAIVVPGSFGFFKLFPTKTITIPWCKIKKLGDDVILVDMGDYVRS